ncbi:MAG: T9SS type A sorting domain-containing protein [Bacteroidia bacterium]
MYNDKLLIAGTTTSDDLATTDVSVLKGTSDVFFYSARNDNTVNTLRYFGGDGQDVSENFEGENGNGYLMMSTFSEDLPTSNNISGQYQNYYFAKVNIDGGLLYGSYFGYQGLQWATADFSVHDGKTYFATVTQQSGLITTDGSSSVSGYNTPFVMVLNAQNNIEFASYYGAGGPTDEDAIWYSKEPFKFYNGNFYFLAYLFEPVLAGGGSILKATNQYNLQDYEQYILSMAVYNSSTYQLKYSGQIPVGGSRSQIAGFYDDKIYIYFMSYSAFHTVPVNFLSYSTVGYSEISIGYSTHATNTVTPSSQTKCKQGLADVLDGNEVTIAAESFPPIYTYSYYSGQDPLYVMYSGIKYQWQEASSPTGPWTDIAVGVLEDYLPSIGNSNAYYRRIAKGVSFASVGDTSNVVSVLVNGFTAPTVDAGGVKRTCPNSAVTIGGSPTATGGATPYTYSWDLGSFLSSTTIANPVATVPVTTVFEVLVTDNNGCKQIDQVVVMAHKANAGPDKGACSGVATLIEAEPVVGYTGVTYSWSPSTGLSATNIAQPMANPASTTTYTLTQVLTKSGGGTCTTTDQVIVTPVSITGGFAGADKVICRGSTTSLGASPQSGFTYTWAPGNYLTSNNASTTTFDAGSFFPSPNPFTYYVTATKAGCTFVDDVVVSVIDANAGVDGCGPRVVGVGDQTPNITETWTWTKISGGGNFSSGAPLNQATSNVTATPSGSSTYQLTASYGGTTCTDQVIVPQCGCVMNIGVSAPHGCPKTAFGDTVWLTATGASILDLNPNNFTYSWSATGGVGLSSTTGRTIYITNGNAGTVTVTASSVLDPGFSCSASLAVNTPAWSLPTFSALQDTICSGTTVSVGQAPVSGYSYLWSGAGLSSTTVSNPTVTPTVTSSYYVRVTDAANGCFVDKSANVAVRDVVADAGPDWYTCQNAIVQLGTPALPNYSYYWLPTSTWQNGTSQTSAQPEVRVSTNISYNVLVTDNVTGCTKRDTVDITVMSTPTIYAGTDKVACKGGAGVQIGLPALHNVTYSWSPSTGLSSSKVAQPIANPNSTTVYTLTATFPGCGATATDQVVVTVSDPSFTMSDIQYCPSSGPVDIGTNAPTGMTSYSWSPAHLVSDPSIRNPSTNVGQPTTFTLTVTNSNGCSAKASLLVSPNNPAPIAGEDATICTGDEVTLGSVDNTTGTFAWSPSTNLSCGSCAEPVFSTNSAGTYRIVLTQTVADKFGTCVNSDTVDITVKAYTQPVLATSYSTCSGNSIEIGYQAVAGIDYYWSPSNLVSDPYSSITTTTVTTSQLFTLVAINPDGCVKEQSTFVAVSPIAAPTITMSDLTLCLSGGTGNFNPSISPSGTYTYLWTPPTGLSNPNIQNPNVSPITSGVTTYELTATNQANGCFGTETANLNVINCTPLPVEIIAFDANWKGQAVEVVWSTASEMNNSHFIVERSIDGGLTYIEIGFVSTEAENGNSNYVIDYSFIDIDAGMMPGNVLCYKLKQVDYDGNWEYVGAKCLNKNSKETLDYVLYPNPADDKLNISFGQNTRQSVQIRIINSIGQEMLNENESMPYTDQVLSIDLSDWPRGIYTVEIMFGNRIEAKKLIVR